MKKLISLVVLFAMLVSCEIGVHPRPSKIIVKPHAICAPDPYTTYWASYCDGSCCYEEYYDSGWLCEDAWCYDYYYCSWEYMGGICY